MMLKHLRICFLFLVAGCVASVEPAPPSAPSHWEMSAEYIYNTALLSDKSLREAVRYKELVPLRRKDFPQVYAHYRKMAKRMQVNPLPTIYLNTQDGHPLPQAAARFTREGTSYILINRPARVFWTPRELTAVLAHELVHLKEEHVTAESLAQAFNHPEISVANELEADRVGSGPLGSCDPGALAEALAVVFSMDVQRYLGENPFKTSGDYNTLIGDDHPRREVRMAALKAMEDDPPEECD